MSDPWVKVADREDCPPGRLLAVEAAGEAIVLANVDGSVYALEDQCSHADFALSQGELVGGEVECTLHGARFDACTGRATRLPAIRKVRVYDVETRADGIYVKVE
ncbi:MAG: non-heme iron oxygenase ferredoxin subunit [Gemmatimonadota bacterium]|nr:non-heme iron oxygenase ferredoxin subunit [Gemmatimonadota bacterium]